MCCLIIVLGDFPALSVLISCIIPVVGWEQTLYDFSSFKFVKGILWPRMWSVWVNVSVSLRRMWIVLLLDEVSYRCQVGLLFGDVHFKYVISDFLPTCWISPFWCMAVLKFPNTVDSYISPWDSVSFCLISHRLVLFC